MVYNVYSSILDFVPKMLSDTYGLDNSLAIIFSVVVPIGVAFGPILMIMLCDKFSNYYFVALIGGIILVGIMAIVLFGYSSNIVVALVTVLLASALSRAVCAVFETVIVARMKDQLNAGSFSAYTHATASFGAAAAPLIMGNSIGLGWSFTYTFILIECVVIVALASSFMLFTKKSKTN
jgi:predicted MFS family arabinose efflux permease